MKLSDFDYHLPEELIAQHPLAKRDASRLLEVLPNPGDSQKPQLNDRIFTEIETLLNKGDLLVFNDTKVIPARVFGKKDSGGKVELFIERVLGEFTALTQIRSSKTPKPGTTIWIGNEANPIKVEVMSRHRFPNSLELSPFFEVRFEKNCLDSLIEFGELPLPPYIEHTPDASDNERYQTVVAKHPGAVAAPTAGLHFDEVLIERLKAKGVKIAFVTLHVGAGTFTPVRTEDLSKHQMHFERYSIAQETFDAIENTHQAGHRVICVGTTSLRALESSVQFGANGDTNLFITPGYKFNLVDALITNFHLPKSTLLMLVSAFAGMNSIRLAYQHAIEHRYRFFSYGDAMFLTRS